jgi:CRISPR-associated protein Cas5h
MTAEDDGAPDDGTATLPPDVQIQQTVDAVADGSVAETAPTITDGTPDRVLSFVLEADWGHFRRIDRTVTKQTYRIPPKTTLAGLLAAIVGAPRDSYYDVFAPESSAMAIAPIGGLRTVTMPSLGVWTNMGERQQRAGASAQSHATTVRWPNTVTDRQRHPYEYLVAPAFRIDVAVEDPTFYRELAARFATGTSHYTPSLGLSELLASVEFLGERRVESSSTGASEYPVYSVVPGGITHTVPTAGTSYHVERTPHAMQAEDDGRTTSSFADYAYTMDVGTDTPDTTQWTGTADRALNEPVTLSRLDYADHFGVINDRLVAFL